MFREPHQMKKLYSHEISVNYKNAHNTFFKTLLDLVRLKTYFATHFLTL